MKRLSLLLLVLLLAIWAVGCDDSSSDDDDDVTPTDGDTDDDDDDDSDGDTDDDDDDDDDDTSDGDTDGDVCEEGTVCSTNDDCCDDYLCHPTEYTCQSAVCASEADCTAGEGLEVACENSFCIDKPCATNADCSAGYACQSGVCAEAAQGCGSVDHVTLDQAGLVLSEGSTAQLSATAWNANGAKIVFAEGVTPFVWSVEEAAAKAAADCASVDANGLLTGGTETGAFMVKVACSDDAAKSDDATYMNYAAVADGSVRVVVFNENSGEALEGITVAIEGVATAGTTDASGVAVFESQDCSTNGCNVHVYETDGDYSAVSVMSVMANDLLIPLVPAPDATKAGGFKAPFTWDEMPAVLQKDLRVGVAASSIPGNLVNVDFMGILGDLVLTDIELGSIEESITLPQGLELWLDETQVVGPARVSGLPGMNSIWGLGGFLKMGDVIGLVTDAMSGGDIDIPALLPEVLPMLEDFYHGLVPSLEFEAMAKIQDVDDANDNGSTDDLIADFENFPALPNESGKVSFNRAMDQNVTISYNNLPAGSSGVVSLVGAMQTGIGFVPLGLGVAMEESEGAGVSSVDAFYAIQHSGLVGYPYYVLSIALDVQGLIDGDGSINIAGVIDYRQSDAPASVTAGTFMSLFGTVTATPDEDKLAYQSDADATFVRATYTAEGRTWNVFYPAGNQEITITRPADMPDMFTDADGMLIAARLADGNGNISFDDVFEFNSTNVNMLNDLAQAFVIFDID